MAELRAPTAVILSETAGRLTGGRFAPMLRVNPTHRGFASREAFSQGGATAPAWVEAMPWGQPIDDPPPIVEPLEPEANPAPESDAGMPVATPSGRPTRRLFLAPAARDVTVPAPPLPVAPAPVAQEPETSPELELAAEEPIAPWWRARPAAQQQPVVEPPQLVADAPQRVAAAAIDRWRAAGRGASAWWRHQKRPIAVAIAVVALVVVVGGLAGFGPLGWLERKAAPPPPRIAEVPKPRTAPDDPVARAPFYLDRAKAGDAESQLELAILYAKGEGVAQDYQQAAAWFRKAAEQGVARAQYDLGVLCERGRGVPINYDEAFSWYSRAAEGNFALAQYNLAVAYTRGQGTRQDFVAAAGWYQRAATQGVVPAMVNLAILYERGEGLNASAIDAYAWYRAAAARGNQPSAKRAAELLDVLSSSDRAKAEIRTTTVLATLPAPAPGQGAAAQASTPTLKSGIESDAAEGGDGKIVAGAH